MDLFRIVCGISEQTERGTIHRSIPTFYLPNFGQSFDTMEQEVRQMFNWPPNMHGVIMNMEDYECHTF